MQIAHFFDKDTFTLTYVLWEESQKDAVIIDPVLDYDPAGGIIFGKSLDQLRAFVSSKQLNVRMILETHAHADHLSSAHYLKNTYKDAPLAIGEGITKVQALFKNIFQMPDLAIDGRQFDMLLQADRSYKAGRMEFKVLNTPGHTPACCSYVFGDQVFVGDLLFMPDYGTGRCDFPGGSAERMYDSITKKIYSLPETFHFYVGHDYLPNGRELKFHATIGESKGTNLHLKGNTTRDEFVKFRTERDKTLSAPRLLFPSVQFNINAGNFEHAGGAGPHFFKIPLTVKV